MENIPQKRPLIEFMLLLVGGIVFIGACAVAWYIILGES